MRGDNSIEMSENQILKSKVKKYVDTVMTEEYINALNLVNEMSALLENIKKDLKKENKTKLIYREENKMKGLKFNIGKNNRVDVKALPDEIREQYKVEMEVWKKEVVDIEIE